MRALYLIVGALIAVAISGVVYATHNAPALEDRVATLEAFHGIDYSDPTATEVPSATATATATAGAAWHSPTNHEHGDAPPAWVLSSGLTPYFGDAEKHEGFKGLYYPSGIPSDAGPGQTRVEAYVVAHAMSFAPAHLTQFHSVQFWFRERDSGNVSWISRSIDFGDPANPAARFIRTTGNADNGVRPAMLLTDATSGNLCEQWYSNPNSGINLAWTICGQPYFFDPNEVKSDPSTWVLNPNHNYGLYRSSDMVLSVAALNDLVANPGPNHFVHATILNDTRVEYTANRLSFLRADVQFQCGSQGCSLPN